MNKVQLIARITRDIELRQTSSGVSVCNFTVAVNRRFKNADGNYDADFINCIAWRSQAELITKHFGKGQQIGLVGSIQTRNYEKDGQKVYITEVSIEEVHFVGSKSNQNEDAKVVVEEENLPEMPNLDAFDGFIPSVSADDDLPF